MGYVVEQGSRVSGSGAARSRIVTEVLEASGEHEWVTLAVHGKPVLGSDHKPFRIAKRDHSPWTVYATRREASDA